MIHLRPILIFFLLLSGQFLASGQAPTVTILAGNGGYFDSTLAYASFRGPTHIVFNKNKGEYYVADRGNFRIRVIKGNNVTTLTGNGTNGTTDGVGTAARLTGPTSLALNLTGDTLFFTDAAGNRDGRIRYVVLSGPDSARVKTIAGQSGGNPGVSNNANGLQARFGGGVHSLVIIKGFAYVSDFASGSNRLRRIQLSGTYPVTSLDSNGTFSDNLSKGFVVGEVEGLAKGRTDSVLYIASRTRSQILKCNLQTGVVSVLAGSGSGGSVNGSFSTCTFSNTGGIAFDSAANKLYVTEKGGGNINVGIRVLDLETSTVSAVAGAINASAAVDGPGATARFNTPQNLSWDSNGDLLVGDAGNSRIRRVVTSTNVVSTFAGLPSDDRVFTNPLAVRLGNPHAPLVDAQNNVWFADRSNHVIRKYDAATKTVSIIAGKRGVPGSANGPALDSALFNFPYSMALKGDSLFISDGSGNAPNGIRILNLTTNRVSFFAPIRGQVMVYKNSLLVFGDVDAGASFQNRIIRFNLSTGVRDTLAGTGQNGSTQGPGRLAQIFNPQRGAVRNDTLFFVTGRSSKPWRIRQLALNSPDFRVDTFLTRSQTEPLNNPGQLVIDGFGTMFIANNAFNGGIFRASVPARSPLSSIPAAILPAAITGIDFDTNRNALVLTESSNSRILRVAPIYSVANIAPSFTLARTRDTLWRTDNALKTLAGTTTNVSANTSIFNTVQNQTVIFRTSIPANQVVLFSQVPSVSPEGVLTYKLANNVPFTNINNINVAVSIRAKDNGGTESGGVDSSAAQTFTITIRYQNLAPVFTVTQDTVTVLSQTTTAQTVNNFLTGIASGAAQEPGQNLTVSVSNDNPALFTTAPAFTGNSNSPNRNLTYRINGTLGLANVRVVLRDNGGVANGGQDSTVKQFVIKVATTVSNQILEENEVLAIYPNPAETSVRFSGIRTGDVLEITDLQGRLRKQERLTLSQLSNISELSEGLYFVRIVRNERRIFSTTLLKK